MKRLILLALLGLSLLSCKEATEPAPEPQKNAGIHYFYIQNNLPKNVNLTFNTSSRDNVLLDKEHLINDFYKVIAFSEDKTLVRVFRNVEPIFYYDREPLNCFYYPTLPESFMESAICRFHHPETNNRAYDNLWSGKFWKYKQTSKWEAEYTLIVDEELLNKLDFINLPEEPGPAF